VVYTSAQLWVSAFFSATDAALIPASMGNNMAQVCQCPPLPPVARPTIQQQYEIHIVSLCSSIRLNQVQFDDLRKALLEHERNGFRDGWSRVGSVSITEVAVRDSSI